MTGFVDLHAHYLPGIDDGAPDLDASLAMVDAVVQMGFTVLHATPHQRAGMYLPSRAQIDDAHAQLAGALRDRHAALSFGVAAENFWDDVLHQRLAEGGLPMYPGQRAFLFEVEPGLMPPRLDEILFSIRMSGRLPVLAHPERYRAIQEDLGVAEKLGRTAALLVDLGALDGAYGRPQKKAARRLVEAGLAHAVATDIHKPADARFVSGGLRWLEKRMGAESMRQLLTTGPQHILAGNLP